MTFDCPRREECMVKLNIYSPKLSKEDFEGRCNSQKIVPIRSSQTLLKKKSILEQKTKRKVLYRKYFPQWEKRIAFGRLPFSKQCSLYEEMWITISNSLVKTQTSAVLWHHLLNSGSIVKEYMKDHIFELWRKISIYG